VTHHNATRSIATKRICAPTRLESVNPFGGRPPRAS
jgi:hypothetical protein